MTPQLDAERLGKKDGGVEAVEFSVVAGMEAHKANVLVLQHACAVLRNLAVNAGNKVKIEVKAHKASILVQQTTCAALRNLAVNAGNDWSR